jgi:hypothetical protein
MNCKLKPIAAAVIGATFMMAGPSAFAGSNVSGAGCDTDPELGLGQATCLAPDVTAVEGAIFVAAEQIVSMVSAITDNIGCFQASLQSGPSVTITGQMQGPQAFAFAKLGGYKFVAVEIVNEEATADFFGNLQGGVRKLVTADIAAGAVLGENISALVGTYVADGAFAMMTGNSDFNHGQAQLDEHVIKDFYKGVPQPGDEFEGNPTVVPHLVRDNGLEITTKKSFYNNLNTPQALDELVGAPKSKWLQTSFYRRPNGQGGNGGKLEFIKTRIAPFGSLNCVVTLDITGGGNADQMTLTGKVNVVAAE